MPKFRFLICLTLFCVAGKKVFSWGFMAHQLIAKQAIFTLPPEMLPFYKQNKDLIAKLCLNPDKRRRIFKGEGPRHYFDSDGYGDSVRTLPLFYDSALARCGMDSLMKHGIAHWHLQFLKNCLTKAFLDRNPTAIIHFSAEIAHYLADVQVPLHNTKNYNGQLSNQYGIHALWESQLPESFSDNWHWWTGPAVYQENTAKWLRNMALFTSQKADSVLNIDRALRQKFPPDALYCFRPRGKTLVRAFSQEYAAAFNKKLEKMVERQARISAWAIGSLWLTCWADGGQPDLTPFLNRHFSQSEMDEINEETKAWKIRRREWINQPDTCSH